jgi:hypothetical protein
LLERLGQLAIFARLLLRRGQEIVRLLARLEQDFLAAGLRIQLGVPEKLRRLLTRPSDGFRGDAFAAEDPDEKDQGRSYDRSHEVEDEQRVYRHA